MFIRSITHVYSNLFNWIALAKNLICARLLSSRKKCFRCNVAKNLPPPVEAVVVVAEHYGFWRLLHQRIRQIEKKLSLTRTCSLEKFTAMPLGLHVLIAACKFTCV
jgi:hypothetical protein